VIIRSVPELKKRFHEMAAGDIFTGIIAAGPTKAAMLIDLASRGVHCLPAPLAQMLNSSKVAQALVLQEYMLPKDLFDVIAQYNRHQVGAVISKEDRMHCGRGVRRWDGIETLYSFTALDESSYPFVIQPFQDRLTDVRVIIVDDFIEAYVRYNPHNFRANISAGGESRPHELDPEQEQFCRAVMKRAQFPFAHLDLHILADGRYCLSEIALSGGIRAARINREQLEHKKKAVIDGLVANLT